VGTADSRWGESTGRFSRLRRRVPAEAFEQQDANLTVMPSGELKTADDWKRDARRSELTRLMLGHEEYARFLTFVKRHLKRRQISRLGMTDLAVLEITPKVPYL